MPFPLAYPSVLPCACPPPPPHTWEETGTGTGTCLVPAGIPAGPCQHLPSPLPPCCGCNLARDWLLPSLSGRRRTRRRGEERRPFALPDCLLSLGIPHPTSQSCCGIWPSFCVALLLCFVPLLLHLDRQEEEEGLHPTQGLRCSMACWGCILAETPSLSPCCTCLLPLPHTPHTPCFSLPFSLQPFSHPLKVHASVFAFVAVCFYLLVPLPLLQQEKVAFVATYPPVHPRRGELPLPAWDFYISPSLPVCLSLPTPTLDRIILILIHAYLPPPCLLGHTTFICAERGLQAKNCICCRQPHSHDHALQCVFCLPAFPTLPTFCIISVSNIWFSCPDGTVAFVCCLVLYLLPSSRWRKEGRRRTGRKEVLWFGSFTTFYLADMLRWCVYLCATPGLPIPWDYLTLLLGSAHSLCGPIYLVIWPVPTLGVLHMTPPHLLTQAIFVVPSCLVVPCVLVSFPSLHFGFKQTTPPPSPSGSDPHSMAWPYLLIIYLLTAAHTPSVWPFLGLYGSGCMCLLLRCCLAFALICCLVVTPCLTTLSSILLPVTGIHLEEEGTFPGDSLSAPCASPACCLACTLHLLPYPQCLGWFRFLFYPPLPLPPPSDMTRHAFGSGARTLPHTTLP